MAPREAEDNADAKFWGDKKKSILACYGIFWSGQFKFWALSTHLESDLLN